MVVKIVPNEKAHPPGKLADAELHFTEGLLDLFAQVRRKLDRWSRLQRRAHRSISPKTMSMEPSTATESASMWPLQT